MNVCVLVGSLRKASFNGMLANARSDRKVSVSI
jgi:NAD(P)H-dependent FMN reductase